MPTAFQPGRATTSNLKGELSATLSFCRVRLTTFGACHDAFGELARSDAATYLAIYESFR